MNSSQPTGGILVLGSNSFSGASFIGHSLANKNSVIGMSRSEEAQIPFRSYVKNATSENFHFYNLDLNNDLELIEETLSQVRIDVVVNFAAQSMVAQSWEKPEDWYNTNVVSMAKLCNLLLSQGTIEKFINFTTPEVYGSTNGWIRESFNFAPNTPYAISRAASDWHLKALYENFGFPVIFTRAANVFGEHQRLYRIVPRVILSALTGRKLPLQGGGKSIRSFIHIEDVSDALTKIIEEGKPGESYHISTNELVTIYELVALVAEKLNVNLEDLIEMVPDRPGKDFAYQLDSQKIRSELGWEDKISLSEGLDRTIKWVTDNLDELKEMPLNYEHRR
jgi:dTDP-glucose 4,6-dehydratase